MCRRSGLALASILLLISVAVQAEPKIYRIGTFPIPLMVEDEEHGVFIDLAKDVARRAGVKIEIVVDSTKRTVAEFGSGRIDGFFPALDVTLPKKAEVSSEIYTKRDFGFVLKPARPPKSIADLKGKVIGLTAGYPYVPEIGRSPALRIDYANSDELNVRKLIKGRYDVFVVEEKSGLRAFEKEHVMGRVDYAKEFPLSQQKVFFAFQPDEEGRQLASKFSKALESMKKDGAFKRVMSKAGY